MAPRTPSVTNQPPTNTHTYVSHKTYTNQPPTHTHTYKSHKTGIDLVAQVIPVVCARFPHVRFIVGGDGLIAARHVGYSEDSVKGIIDQIVSLLPPEALSKPAGGP